MPNRFSGRRAFRSPNLQQEILNDSGTISGTGQQTGLINKVLDVAKEVGDVFLKLIILDLIGANITTENPTITSCALLSRPLSEGVPDSSSFDDPKQCVTSYGIGVGAASVINSYHWRQNLRIKVPAGNDLYVACRKESTGSVFCSWRIRLFWQSA